MGTSHFPRETLSVKLVERSLTTAEFIQCFSLNQQAFLIVLRSQFPPNRPCNPFLLNHLTDVS